MPTNAQKTEDLTFSREKELASTYFQDLRNRICTAFEQLEADYQGPKHADKPAGIFTRTPWRKEDLPKIQNTGDMTGGGEISLMKGRVFEKVGVNYSCVHGIFSEEFRKNIPGAAETGEFWASGVSLVAHMQSPLVPAVHMNVRQIITSKQWFGGGADLTPMFPNDQDTADFHAELKKACDKHDPTYYAHFRQECDKYFFLPHRGEPRGVGGIFFDNHNTGNWDKDFSFTKDVGEAFLTIFPKLVARHMNKDWSAEERHHQLVRRGRYVEFNLLYDRGTVFGLKTGGNTDAILMSMPPEVIWE